MAKKKKKEAKDDVFFVGIKEPVEIRRSILESSKEMVQYLQRAEKFKQVRAEKTEEIAKLKEEMREIAVLVKKLKSKFPKTKLRVQMHKHEENIAKRGIVPVEGAEKKRLMAKKIKMAPEAKPAASELEKLEAELSEIESRLTKIA